jgi:2,5-diamino-6-(ribosylamino)-4(3H)-pyrimidinone 5'-phosphate reductase
MKGQKGKMLPHVIIYNGVSLDGRMDWGYSDEGLYYEMVNFWKPDALLSGSNTILTAQFPEMPPKESLPDISSNEEDRRQLLAVVDSQGRISNWPILRRQPWWRDAIALCSFATPKRYLDKLKHQGVEYILAGQDKVDLRRALEELKARFMIKTVRVDSGGVLNGVLLRSGLVDEVCLIINPELVGGTSPRSMYVASDLTSVEGVIRLHLLEVKNLRSNHLWLRYDVIK